MTDPDHVALSLCLTAMYTIGFVAGYSYPWGGP